MGKKRTALGKAELPRSLAQFMEAEPDQLSVSLLLTYIEELEKLNRTLNDANIHLFKDVDNLVVRIEAVELALERAQGNRILKPLTTEELRQANLDRILEKESSGHRSPHGGRGKGNRLTK